jgi:integrase
LNWFENGKNCKHTVIGDKFTAVTEADRINDQLSTIGRSGRVCEQISVAALVERYGRHLNQRADAGEISPRTVARYQSALHYLRRFAEKSGGSRVRLGRLDSEFVLSLKSYLNRLKIHRNGHPHTQPQPMTEPGIRFILSVARAAWHWAKNHTPPLLPEEAQNPFQGHVGSRPLKDLVARTELNAEVLTRLITQADMYQLVLFMPMILYGLRAAEPCYLMIEDWQPEDALLTVACVPDLEYKTKGRINKTFPVPPIIHRLLTVAAQGRQGGPLLLSRDHFEGRKAVPSPLATQPQIVEEYRRRVDGIHSAQRRSTALESVLQEAGAATYDQLSREFRGAVRRADLPGCVTLKSLRHYFASALESANISYFTRKYFMGHRVRRDPLAIYTTTDFEGIRQEFDRLLQGPMAPVVAAADSRMPVMARPPHRHP